MSRDSLKNRVDAPGGPGVFAAVAGVAARGIMLLLLLPRSVPAALTQLAVKPSCRPPSPRCWLVCATFCMAAARCVLLFMLQLCTELAVRKNYSWWSSQLCNSPVSHSFGQCALALPSFAPLLSHIRARLLTADASLYAVAPHTFLTIPTVFSN